MPMKKQCEANLGTWKQLAEERKQQKEAEQAAKEKAEQEAIQGAGRACCSRSQVATLRGARSSSQGGGFC